MYIDFKVILLVLIFSLILSLVVGLLSYVLTDKKPDKEKVTVYECGFDPFHSPGKPFSIRFFLVAILFLVFDLEISYLFPWSCSSNLVDIKGQVIIIIFLIILVMGLIYEWIKGGLEWE
uniref:NADH-ubiquinone oxidoreductase chain 3 n=2 Tax=Obeliidae TaxID=2750047 RepID=G9ISS7_LAOFL|nr:NADH dehydrogenase subunit 3 [Laomedea flexuosa]AER54616.1 NADH dehydrogenase subunit 3 [Obelia longissima]